MMMTAAASNGSTNPPPPAAETGTGSDSDGAADTFPAVPAAIPTVNEIAPITGCPSPETTR